jgi:hypothetical protein
MKAPASGFLMQHKPGSRYRVGEIIDLTPRAAYSPVGRGAIFSSSGRLGT